MLTTDVQKISLQEVDGITRNTIPKIEETIEECIDVEKIFPLLKSLDFYFRDVNDCPFARGNWIIDLRYKNGDVSCIRLPKEMTIEKVKLYIAPLASKFKNFIKINTSGNIICVICNQEIAIGNRTWNADGEISHLKCAQSHLKH